jgi:hypothetical protein
MTLLFFEGFENKEPAGRAGMSYDRAVSFVTGRTSGSAMTCATTSATQLSIPVVSSAVDTWIFSGAFRLDNLGSAAITLLSLVSSASGNQGMVDIAGVTGALRLTPGGVATISTDYVMQVGEWARIDLVSYPHVTAGFIQLWVNGVMIAEHTGRNSATTQSTEVASARIAVGNLNTTRLSVDDVYLANGQGPAPYNGRIGDVRIESLVPSGNGSSSQFAGSDGNSVDNYALVDELPAVTTDYVTGVAWQKDLYQYSNLSVPAGVVHAVQLHHVGNKLDAGAAELVPVHKLGATEHDDSPMGLGLTPVYGQGAIRTVDPDGNPWTVASVNAAEFGYKVV